MNIESQNKGQQEKRKESVKKKNDINNKLEQEVMKEMRTEFA